MNNNLNMQEEYEKSLYNESISTDLAIKQTY